MRSDDKAGKTLDADQVPKEKSSGFNNQQATKQADLINSYEIGKTTLDEFENDGWNISDVAKGIFGIVGRYEKDGGILIIIGADFGMVGAREQGYLTDDMIKMTTDVYMKYRGKVKLTYPISNTATPFVCLFFKNRILQEKEYVEP